MFDPTVDLDCYYVAVDADSYHRVELEFADGTTAVFDGEYSGRTAFGFSGDGRLSTDTETTVDTFCGPIEQATVRSRDRSRTVTRSGPCVFDDLTFDCDSAQFTRGDDVRVAFVDGSFKQWDSPPFDQLRFGSPGRIIESISEETVDVTVQNPDQDCQPGTVATVFNARAVTIEAAEFAGESAFEQATLELADGTTETFGTLDGEPTFVAPETFTASHTDSPIAAVVIQQLAGDIVFRLVNPVVESSDRESAGLGLL